MLLWLFPDVLGDYSCSKLFYCWQFGNVIILGQNFDTNQELYQWKITSFQKFYRTQATYQYCLEFGCHTTYCSNWDTFENGSIINNYNRNVGLNQTISGKLGYTASLIIRIFTSYFLFQIICLCQQVKTCEAILRIAWYDTV